MVQGRSTTPMNTAGANLANPTDGNNGGPSVTGEWASLISNTTLEDEIKATKLEIDKVVGIPGKFKGAITNLRGCTFQP